MRLFCMILGLVGMMVAASCTPQQTTAWKQCEAGKLPSVAEAVLIDVAAILFAGRIGRPN
jgi:hypothetical protein